MVVKIGLQEFLTILEDGSNVCVNCGLKVYEGKNDNDFFDSLRDDLGLMVYRLNVVNFFFSTIYNAIYITVEVN